MFRQTIVLACLIALAVASENVWFGIGERVEGDRNLSNQTSTSFPTELPTNHTVNLLFFGGESTFTFGRFDVLGDEFDYIYIYGIDNGFNVTITTYNTTQLSAQATIFGFPPGEAPVGFKPKKITSRGFSMK